MARPAVVVVCVNARQKWRKANPKRLAKYRSAEREAKAAWRAANRDKILAYSREYYAKRKACTPKRRSQ